MNKKSLGSILFFSLLSASCATIVSGPTQEVSFHSTPEGASVKVNGVDLGKTPLTIKLEKKEEQTLVFEKEGYKPFKTSMYTSLDPWFWGNIVIGGFLGSTTDGISGSMNQYTPGQYIVTLEPESTSQLDTYINLSQKENARRFMFLNYENLKIDLSRNSGEYLDALLKILSIESSKYNVVANDIKDILFASKDAADFIDTTINKYINA